jgi:hypothetical protein
MACSDDARLKSTVWRRVGRGSSQHDLERRSVLTGLLGSAATTIICLAHRYGVGDEGGKPDFIATLARPRIRTSLRRPSAPASFCSHPTDSCGITPSCSSTGICAQHLPIRQSGSVRAHDIGQVVKVHLTQAADVPAEPADVAAEMRKLQLQILMTKASRTLREPQPHALGPSPRVSLLTSSQEPRRRRLAPSPAVL